MEQAVSDQEIVHGVTVDGEKVQMRVRDTRVALLPGARPVFEDQRLAEGLPVQRHEVVDEAAYLVLVTGKHLRERQVVVRRQEQEMSEHERRHIGQQRQVFC
ncbi:hypothetical protein DMC64_13180 [Amycolatopsis sp. WAC 04197]|nr:hypothetical protein DMC64_13180 [Amycolatopsis sp. WAC 04197]